LEKPQRSAPSTARPRKHHAHRCRPLCFFGRLSLCLRARRHEGNPGLGYVRGWVVRSFQGLDRRHRIFGLGPQRRGGHRLLCCGRLWSSCCGLLPLFCCARLRSRCWLVSTLSGRSGGNRGRGPLRRVLTALRFGSSRPPRVRNGGPGSEADHRARHGPNRPQNDGS
jgi:hypothetical protein